MKVSHTQLQLLGFLRCTCFCSTDIPSCIWRQKKSPELDRKGKLKLLRTIQFADRHTFISRRPVIAAWFWRLELKSLLAEEADSVRAKRPCECRYYLAQHPSVTNIITAFRDGVDHDSGLLVSHFPDLTIVMTQLPNSRQTWFSHRLGIEAISRDLWSPNLQPEKHRRRRDHLYCTNCGHLMPQNLLPTTVTNAGKIKRKT